MSSRKKDTRAQILHTTWQLLEQQRGQGVRMSDIAKAVGISRQALYLHFASRTELMVATITYVDEVKGLNERLKQLHAATSGIELLEACVEVWGNYIPEIYGLAKALLNIRETDEAAAAAWSGCTSCLHDICREVIETIDREGILAPDWSQESAVEIFGTIISIHNWEQLVIECGWSTDQYIARIKILLKRTLIDLKG